MRGHPFLAIAILFGIASFASSCNLDPVHRAGVNNLLEENPDLYPPETEFHRPGEPCALCHSKAGPAESQFVLAGTIFWGPDSYQNRVDNAYVRVVDARGTKKCFVTNCNGNFFARPEQFPRITFPLLVSVERTVDPGKNETELKYKSMAGHIGREASCAICHIQGLRDFASPGQIFLFSSEDDVKKANPKFVNCNPGPPPDYQQQALCPEDRP
jgi:hypothetical protein